MKNIYCGAKEAGEYLKNKRIIIFGAGSWLKAVECSIIEPFCDQIQYVIDNNPSGKKCVFGRYYDVFNPKKLENESECIIILVSPVYMYDMYLQLNDMNLSDDILCIALPFLVNDRIRDSYDDLGYKDLLLYNSGQEKKGSIPKMIHSFWFSGEEKPDCYQRCIDTWKEKCPDYEIIEWNQNNYDCTKNPFLRRAIDLNMWAYATDYARMDVLYNYGGIYLDMDVEILRPFDDLLKNNAVFCFSSISFVDAAVFLADKGNNVVNRLLHLYDFVDIPENKTEFKRYFFPSFGKDVFLDEGVHFNGQLQIFDKMIVVPPEFFFPLDTVLFDDPVITDYTYTIHYDNFGWSIGKSNSRIKKIENNRKMRQIFFQN